MLFNQVVSERTLLVWMLLCVVATIGSSIVGAVAIWIAYGCWPIGLTQIGSGCLSQIEPAYLVFSPLLIGVIAASLLAFRIAKET